MRNKKVAVLVVAVLVIALVAVCTIGASALMSAIRTIHVPPPH